MTTKSNSKEKRDLYLGISRASSNINVLDAITEFATNTNAYLEPKQIDDIVTHLNKQDYIEVLRKYLTHENKKLK